MKKIIFIFLTLSASIGFSQPFSATNQVISPNTNTVANNGRGLILRQMSQFTLIQ